MKPVCVVFDLDDTLYLERDYVRSGFRALEPWVRRHLGLENFYFRAWSLFQQGQRGNIFDKVLSAAGVNPNRDTIQVMVNLYRRHSPDIQLAMDAANCLRSLIHHVHLALISDGPEQSQRNKIKALGIDQSFEIVVLTSALGRRYAKPHCKAFVTVQEYFGESVNEFIYVADNPTKDFLGPRSLRWKTIRVRREEGLYFSLTAEEGGSADVEMPTLSSLASTIIGDQRG